MRAHTCDEHHRPRTYRDFCVDVDLEATEATKPGAEPFFAPYMRNATGTWHAPEWWK